MIFLNFYLQSHIQAKTIPKSSTGSFVFQMKTKRICFLILEILSKKPMDRRKTKNPVDIRRRWQNSATGRSERLQSYIRDML